MRMKITRFRKYITWNIVSAIGYICSIITIIFLIIFSLAASNLNMRADLNEYFYAYITKHILLPYLSFYKFQLFLISCCLIASVFENRHYKEKGEYGLRLFGNHEKIYSILFFTGLILNFLPLYILFMFLITQIMKIITNL